MTKLCSGIQLLLQAFVQRCICVIHLELPYTLQEKMQSKVFLSTPGTYHIDLRNRNRRVLISYVDIFICTCAV